MSGVCLNQVELAARWKISHRTLERWRWAQGGPRYLKLGGRAVSLEHVLCQVDANYANVLHGCPLVSLVTSASQAWRIATPLGRELHPPHLWAKTL